MRTSILLVDVVRHTDRAGRSMRAVGVEAGAVGFKPTLLTSAAMIGAAFTLPDSIVQGLAVSLLFGLP